VGQPGKFRVYFLTWGGRVAWILRLVKTGAEGDGQSTDVMEINKPDDLGDIATLGLSLAEAKLLLAGVQREIVAAQTRAHAVRRPDCRCGGGVCHVKDYRDHAIATLFGQVTVRLPRFRCAACGAIEVGGDWPSHCRSLGRGSPCGGYGGDEGTRTPDPRDANAVLFQLSYIPTRSDGQSSTGPAERALLCRCPVNLGPTTAQ
jgi:hypothetical protein